jgi:hypothetical protein
MTKEELIKNQFPNDEFLQSGVSQIVDKCIAELEKENAELKEKYVKNITDCYICDTYCNSQLTKAKEIIREFVEWATWQGNSKCPSFKSIQDKAEQFLNSEVEK